MRLASSAWVCLAAILGVCLPALAFDVEVLQDAGDPANRIDLVLLGDGYRVEDQAQLTQDARAFVNAVFGAAPFAEYRGYFNIKLIHVTSRQTGADNGTYGAERDTALGATFYCYDIPQLLCVDDSDVIGITTIDTPEVDFAVVIVNDPMYGGSGGSLAVVSIHELAGEIALHEFGHSFGGLADEYDVEYDYPVCGTDCPEPNITTKTVREQIKWFPWIDPATPLPTPETDAYRNVVGAFEGARYKPTGLYRPRLRCRMAELGVPYCEVCSEAITWSVYDTVDPIDGMEPASPLELGICDQVILEVFHPPKDTLVVTWTLDGQPTGDDGADADTLPLDSRELDPGSHQVIVQVADVTPSVRRDPELLLLSQASWDIQVDASRNCTIDGSCVPAQEPDPRNPCQECDPAANPNDWTPDDTNPCDDGDACTGEDFCRAGVCMPGARNTCPDEGCGCAHGSGHGWTLAILAALPWLGRRRRAAGSRQVAAR